MKKQPYEMPQAMGSDGPPRNMRLLIEHRVDINVRARPEGLPAEGGGRSDALPEEVRIGQWKKMEEYSFQMCSKMNVKEKQDELFDVVNQRRQSSDMIK